MGSTQSVQAGFVGGLGDLRFTHAIELRNTSDQSGAEGQLPRTKKISAEAWSSKDSPSAGNGLKEKVHSQRRSRSRSIPTECWLDENDKPGISRRMDGQCLGRC